MLLLLSVLSVHHAIVRCDAAARCSAAKGARFFFLRATTRYMGVKVPVTPPCVCQLMSACVSICQHVSAYVSIRQRTSAYVSIRQQGARLSAYVSIRKHTSAYVSIRQQVARLSAYVSIRKHTSAYVSIRQHTSARCQGLGASCLHSLLPASPYDVTSVYVCCVMCVCVCCVCYCVPVSFVCVCVTTHTKHTENTPYRQTYKHLRASHPTLL
jgi:hypothetical protein